MYMTKQTLLGLAVMLGALNLQPLAQAAESNAPALPPAAAPPGAGSGGSDPGRGDTGHPDPRAG